MPSDLSGANTSVIQWLSPDHPDRTTALHLLVGRESASPAQANRDVRSLLRSVRQQSLVFEMLCCAKSADRMVGVAAAIESPGRTALVMLGPTHGDGVPKSTGVAMLRELQERAWTRDLILLQALPAPDQQNLGSIYREADFKQLATLVYLERPLDAPKAAFDAPSDLSYFSYSSELNEQFIGVLQESYRGSLDCPGLAGLRDTKDVLNGHKHTGLGDPGLWLLAVRGEKPVGLLLMAGVVDRSCLEIVYMGVVADERGRNIGDALLSMAVDVGRQRRMNDLTLAVDGANHFAWRLYQRWGFVEVSRREAWIARRPC